jgi:hypothetical protein
MLNVTDVISSKSNKLCCVNVSTLSSLIFVYLTSWKFFREFTPNIMLHNVQRQPIQISIAQIEGLNSKNVLKNIEFSIFF